MKIRPPDVGLGLTAKIALAVAVVLSVAFAVFAVVHLRYEEQQVYRRAGRTAELIGRVTREGLRHAMLAGRRDEVRALLESHVEQPGVQAIRVFHPGTGKTWLEASRNRVDPITKPDNARRLLVGEGTISRWVEENGRHVIAVALPIVNEPRCHRCHDSDARVLGAVDVHLDATDLYTEVIGNRFQLSWFSLVAVLAVSGTLCFLLFRLVTVPARRLRDALARFESGDLDTRAEVSWRDEFGQLSEGFNAMADRVQGQVRRVERLYEAALQMRETRDPDERAEIGIRGVREGLGFDRIVFLAVDAEANVLRGHSAVGVSADLVKRVVLPLNGDPHPLRETVRTGRAQVVAAGLWDPSMSPAASVRCWEYHQCTHADCPAYHAEDRRCWLVSQTFCHDRVQGSYAEKTEVCADCPVLHQAYGDQALAALLMLGSTEFAALPVASRDGVTGVFIVDNVNSKRPLTEEDLGALSVFAAHLAVSVEHGRLARQLESRVESADEELRARLHELSAARSYTESVLRNIGNGLIAVDREGAVRAFNPAASRILRMPADEALGRPAGEVFVPVNGSLTWHEVRRETSAGSSISQRVRLRRADGSEVSAVLAASPLREEGGAVMVLEDLTEREEFEAHLRRADRMATLGHLSAGLAHEIKNPLAGIGGAAQVLRDEFPDEDPRREVMGEIVAQIGTLDESINNFLRYARPQPPEFAPVQLDTVVDAVRFLATKPAEGREITLTSECERELPPVKVDAGQVQQVLLNIALNALDAVEPGRGRVTLRAFTIPEEERVVVEIADNGCGMEPEVAQQIFDPYYTTKPSGTGLGLAIAQRLADDNRGVLTVESTPGEGTTFRLSFPVAAAREEVTADGEAQSSGG